jgi:hypothetical protein
VATGGGEGGGCRVSSRPSRGREAVPLSQQVSGTRRRTVMPTAHQPERRPSVVKSVMKKVATSVKRNMKRRCRTVSDRAFPQQRQTQQPPQQPASWMGGASSGRANMRPVKEWLTRRNCQNPARLLKRCAGRCCDPLLPSVLPLPAAPLDGGSARSGMRCCECGAPWPGASTSIVAGWGDGC